MYPNLSGPENVTKHKKFLWWVKQVCHMCHELNVFEAQPRAQEGGQDDHEFFGFKEV